MSIEKRKKRSLSQLKGKIPITPYHELIRKSIVFFGGIQVVLLGDFIQLPPISGEYCFLSEKWSSANFKVLSLTQNMRQTEPEFQDLLENLRWGKCTDENYNLLLSLKNNK